MELLTVDMIRDRFGWKEGMKFKCVEGSYCFNVGETYKMTNSGIKNSSTTVPIITGSAAKFELIQTEHPNPPHKHCDLIIEWAKGAEIEMMCSDGWRTIGHPPWSESHREFRIKPDNSDKIAEIETKMRELADELEKLK